MHNIVKFHYRCNNAALIRLRKTTGPSLLSCSRVAVRCFRSAFNGTLGRPGGPLVHVWSGSKKGPRTAPCVERTPLLSGMIFFRFLFFSTARTREQGWETCRKGGEKRLMRRGEFAQCPNLKFGKISIRIIFGIEDIEWRDWNGNKVDLPIAKYILEIPSLGIYGSDNSNWSNGEDLLARHVRSCTSKSC